MVEITPEGRPVVGDALVELDAANVAAALRDLPPHLRQALAASWAGSADAADSARLTALFEALGILASEVDAEEIRRLNAALQD